MIKQISTFTWIVLGLCAVLFTGCNDSSNFTVKGVVAGADGQTMYLENVGIADVTTLDSVKLSPGGKFKFSKPKPEYPDFYRLRLNNQLINFAIDSTETVSIMADAGTFATSYTVEGSENSKAIKAITLAQLDANQAISRLRKEQENKMISDTTYQTQVVNVANAYKEVAQKYIYEAPMSTAAYFALFQSCIIKRPYNLFHRKNLYVRLQEVERSFGNKKTWDTPFEVHFRKFVKEANDAVFDNGHSCRATNQDVFDITSSYDLVYIDTPYLNDAGIGVDYADFYHFLNGLIDYEHWNSRIDYKSKHRRLKRTDNVWTDANRIKRAFERLFALFPNSTLAISYRSNGIPSIEELIHLLEAQGRNVTIYRSGEIKYVLSNKESNEILIVAREKGNLPC